MPVVTARRGGTARAHETRDMMRQRIEKGLGLQGRHKRRLEQRNCFRVFAKNAKKLITLKAIKANGRPPAGCAVHFYSHAGGLPLCANSDGCVFEVLA